MVTVKSAPLDIHEEQGKSWTRLVFEGGEGLPDQFSFCEALKGETGDVDTRFFTKDQLGYDFSHRRAVLEAMAAEAIGQEESPQSGKFSQDGMVIGRDLIGPAPAGGNLRLFHNRHPVHA